MRELEPEAVAVLDRLHHNGFDAYLVGGFVRDSLLQKPTQDIDIATSAKPEEVIGLFEHTVPTGLQHGTVTVLVNKKAYEVTTFRSEADYEQHRRPKQVVFVSDLLEDLQRRDFTINAMAFDRNGELVDPFGGWQDLKQGRVRCVGSPEERFQEDALRMMRAIRFAANYGFEIENETWEALTSCKALLRYVAMERIYAEWHKMMEGTGAFRGLQLLVDSGLLAYLKKPLNWPIANWQGQHVPNEWAVMEEHMAAGSRWAIAAIGMRLDAVSFQNGARVLTMPSKLIRSLAKLLEADQWVKRQLGEASGSNLCVPQLLWKRAILQWGAPVMLEWAELVNLAEKAVLLYEQEQTAVDRLVEMAHYGKQWLDELEATQISELKIGGGELAHAFERREGPWIGKLLRQLLSEVVLNQLPNEKNVLIDKAKSLLKSDSYE
ncbi:CCA tRNA nucleotidyltransferase [Paenibacillus senegalensis]|uniref:CCA tRNA nucleotidyltransferase n=1 Tax=Paenibacillus senegalensis TaxID=1465766 RepID=UPI000288ECF9|nr:CCA tRNA nucleotidyltransferase [Paenibacillus senegalensis]